MIFFVYFYGKLSVIHDFSVWLITNFNPVDINRFPGHTGKLIAFSLKVSFKAQTSPPPPHPYLIFKINNKKGWSWLVFLVCA